MKTLIIAIPCTLFVLGIVLDYMTMRKHYKTYVPFRSIFRKSFPNYISPFLYMLILVPLLYGYLSGKDSIGIIEWVRIVLLVAWAMLNPGIIRYALYSLVPKK